MGKSALKLVLAMAVGAKAVCEPPHCEMKPTPCDSKAQCNCNKTVGYKCATWPHHCSQLLHGSDVVCSEDFECLCGVDTCASAPSSATFGSCTAPSSATMLDASGSCKCDAGTCPDAEGKCAKQAQFECNKDVGSTCATWPHYCSKLLHGADVTCSEDFVCRCGGAGDTCAYGGSCKSPWSATMLEESAEDQMAPLPGQTTGPNAFLTLLLIASLASAGVMLTLRFRRPSISAAPPPLG